MWFRNGALIIAPNAIKWAIYLKRTSLKKGLKQGRRSHTNTQSLIPPRVRLKMEKSYRVRPHLARLVQVRMRGLIRLVKGNGLLSKATKPPKELTKALQEKFQATAPTILSLENLKKRKIIPT